MGRYFLSSRAETDLLAVWKYIAKDSLTAADRMIDRFTAAFQQISQFPKRVFVMIIQKASSAS